MMTGFLIMCVVAGCTMFYAVTKRTEREVPKAPDDVDCDVRLAKLSKEESAINWDKPE